MHCIIVHFGQWKKTSNFSASDYITFHIPLDLKLLLVFTVCIYWKVQTSLLQFMPFEVRKCTFAELHNCGGAVPLERPFALLNNFDWLTFWRKNTLWKSLKRAKVWSLIKRDFGNFDDIKKYIDKDIFTYSLGVVLRLLVTTIIPSQREAKGLLLLNLSLANASFLLTLIYLPVPWYLQENVKVEWLGSFFQQICQGQRKGKERGCYCSICLWLMLPFSLPWYIYQYLDICKKVK